MRADPAVSNDNDPTPPPRGGNGEFLAVAFAYAGLCFLADMASGARVPFWLGWTALELAEAFAGWLIYLAPIYGTSIIAFVVTLCVRPLRRFTWWVRLLSVLVAALGIRAGAAAAIGGAAWGPWFVFDVLLLTSVVALARLGSRSLFIPVLTALVSVVGSALILNWSADLAIGGRGDPVMVAALTNRGVLFALLFGSCYALLVGRWKPERTQRILRPLLAIVPFLILVACALGVTVLKRPLSADAEIEGPAPNLVIVTADALRADYCSVYGGAASTPSLERLADAGAKFERFYSLAPWTSPALYGFFSSRYPPGLTPAAVGKESARWIRESSTYALIEDYWIGTGERLSAELRARGYRIAAAVGNPVLQADDWLLKDTEELRIAEFSFTEIRGPFRAIPVVQYAASRCWPDSFARKPVDMTRSVTQFAEAYIRYAREQPFMLWLHYFDPHTPYDPPSEYRELDGRWPYFPPDSYRKMALWDMVNWIKDMPETDRGYVRSLYQGEIEYMDAGVGRILDAIETNGISRNTYVIFSADHGEELWDHEGIEHGHSLFEDQIRVPFIVRGPGIKRATVHSPVSAIDALPTIRDWMSLPGSPGAYGVSLAQALSGDGDFPERPVFVQSTSLFTQPLQTVIDGKFKAIHGTHSGLWSLFDLDADRAERSDLAGGDSDALSRLKRLMDDWSKSFPVTFDKLEIEADDDRVYVFEELLESMGYLN